ncbi:transposase [Streptomyces sp. NPDC060286]|uniref:transposase n=1 Tax=unclassified Streptomyces TaxID=2593676 RepID=UPI0035DC1B8F
MTKTKAVRVSLLPDAVRRVAFAEASRFRGEFYECLTDRRDELFELVDAVLCADGAVKSPVDLTLLPEHRRGHGAMYGGLNHGRIDVDRLVGGGVVAHAQLRLARPLAEDFRRPWEKPTASGRLTPARVRRGLRNIRAHLACPTRVPKPTGTGPGRPPGAKNKRKAPLNDVGKTVKRPEILKAIGRPGRSW